ncbi:MAG TPA: hypothetical protein PK431_01085 [Chitinophagales bacterium]|nr:hypothetical protein [Chitinophagales bacterium]
MDIFAIEKIRSNLFKTLDRSKLENINTEIIEIEDDRKGLLFESETLKIEDGNLKSVMIIRDVDTNKLYQVTNIKKMV